MFNLFVFMNAKPRSEHTTYSSETTFSGDKHIEFNDIRTAGKKKKSRNRKPSSPDCHLALTKKKNHRHIFAKRQDM